MFCFMRAGLFFSYSSPLVLIVFSLTSRVEKSVHDLFVYFSISILCFFLFMVSSLPHPLSQLWSGGAVMECLAVTEEMLANDCSFRPLPGGLLFMDECVFISSAVSPRADLGLSPWFPWYFSTTAH